MNIMRYIRTEIFRLNQRPFADLMGVNQSTVARWEDQTFSPDLRMLKQLRRLAREQGLPWRDEVIWELAMGPDVITGERVSVTMQGTLD